MEYSGPIDFKPDNFGHAHYIAPRDELELKLAQIWQNVLGIERIGVADRFHEIGGDSLQAAVIFSEIESVYGISVPMVTILSAPTIAELAAKIRSLKKLAQA